MNGFHPRIDASRFQSFWTTVFKHKPVLKQNKRGFILSLFFLILFFILIMYSFLHFHKKVTLQSPVIPVAVKEVQKKDVPVYIPALGNVIATQTVTIKTQVNGLLMQVNFKEGQHVKKGELLAEIDQRLLLAQLKQYKGQLIRDEALLSNAEIDLKRYQVLWKQDSISQQTLATQAALVKQYQGDVETDKGLIQSTRVNLIYCHITSPVDGRVGLQLVDPGNFVQTTDTTGIAVVTTLDPITVIFSLPEDNIPDVLPQFNAGLSMPVKAYSRQDTRLLSTGKLIAVDNQINTATGTVNLRAVFDNKQNKLFSNQFVNIKILVKMLHNMTVVATAAIQHGSESDFVYGLMPGDKVKVLPVKTGITYGDDTVVLNGLTPGQQVVTEGLDRLTDGAHVRIV